MSTSVALPMLNTLEGLRCLSRRMTDRQISQPIVTTRASAVSPVPHQEERRPVRRSLFGPVDHEQCQAFITTERQRIQEAERRQYNFDFVKELPLTGGRYVWKRVSPVTNTEEVKTVPEAYSAVCSRLTESICTTSKSSGTTCTTSAKTEPIIHATTPPSITTTTTSSTTCLTRPIPIRPCTSSNNSESSNIKNSTESCSNTKSTNSSSNSNTDNKEKQLLVTEFVKMSRKRPSSSLAAIKALPTEARSEQEAKRQRTS